MADLHWNLLPYESIGPLRFGMSPKEVETVLGPAEKRIEGSKQFAYDDLMMKLFGNRDTEHRTANLPIVSYENNKLIEVEFHEKIINIFLEEKELFSLNRKKLLDYLSTFGGEIYDSGDTYIFISLGISTGHIEFINENKSIVVFSRNAFDKIIEEFDYDKKEPGEWE